MNTANIQTRKKRKVVNSVLARVTRAQSLVPSTNPTGPSWHDNLCAQDTGTILLFYLYNSLDDVYKTLFRRLYPQLTAVFEIIDFQFPETWSEVQYAMTQLVYRENYQHSFGLYINLTKAIEQMLLTRDSNMTTDNQQIEYEHANDKFSLISFTISSTCVHETLGEIAVIESTQHKFLEFRTEHYCDTLQNTINAMFSSPLPLYNATIAYLRTYFQNQPESAWVSLTTRRERLITAPKILAIDFSFHDGTAINNLVHFNRSIHYNTMFWT